MLRINKVEKRVYEIWGTLKLDGMIREGFTEKEIFEKRPERSKEMSHGSSYVGKSIPGLGNSKTGKKACAGGLGHMWGKKLEKK